MKKIYLIIIIIICSCKHNNCEFSLCVQGNVLNISNNLPIKNSIVYLGYEFDNGLNFPITKIIDSTISDANGYYKFFKSDYDHSNQYFVIGLNDKFFKTIEKYNLIIPGNNKINILLNPEAFLKINFKNIHGINQADELTINEKWFYDLHGINFSFKGLNIDTSIIYRVKGDNLISFSTKTTRTSQNTIFTNYKIYCKSSDTTNLLINY